MAQVETFARSKALSARFRNDPAGAVRWAMSASSIEVDLALAADTTLDLIAMKRMSVEAEKAGDRERAMRLQAVAARLNVDLQNTGKRNRVRGWRE